METERTSAAGAVKLSATWWMGTYLLLGWILAVMVYFRYGYWWATAVEIGGVMVFALAHGITHTIVWTGHKVRHGINPFTNEVDK